jgi:cellulose synthase (UDP-forming)
MLLNFSAFVIGLLRLFLWNTYETGTVLLNLFWCLYSMLLLGAAVGVASESRQVRRMHRVSAQLPATLYLDTGEVLHCECVDFSMSGFGLQVTGAPKLQTHELVHVGLWSNGVEHAFPARVTLSKGQMLGVQLEPLDQQQEIAMVQCTFARPNAWDNWSDSHDQDRPLHGLQEIAKVGVQGYRQLFSAFLKQLDLTLTELRERRNRLYP